VLFAPGYAVEDSAEREPGNATVDQDLLVEAVAIAQASDVALVFVGSTHETEGADRDNIDLPAAHRRLIEEVARVNPRTS